ncbi:MAG: hypothetical protein CM1200mP29_06450 [Verrucomicrobiota bacterium]|nr:MAG: hypothetical protein CM1200mP29_06450 [Verrucomicrobiota bacterium]
MSKINRRRFLKQSANSGAVAFPFVLTQLGQAAKTPPASGYASVWSVRPAVRGNSAVFLPITRMSKLQPSLRSTRARVPKTLQGVTGIQGRKPKTTTDFRKLIDDPKIDALCIGTPDHWHAIPTILGCLAGKDVYVEKPDSHNIVEGHRMVQAMRKHKRIIQMGSHTAAQTNENCAGLCSRRALGRCLVAKAWESTKQGSIGHSRTVGAQGSGLRHVAWFCAEAAFNPRRFMEVGVGFLIMARATLATMGCTDWTWLCSVKAAVETEGGEPLRMPRRISGTGGKWYFDDAQEWPDTMQVTYEYPGAPPVFSPMKCASGRRTNTLAKEREPRCLVIAVTSPR